MLISPKDVSVKLSFDIWGVLINSKKKITTELQLKGTMKGTFQSASNLLYSLLVTMKILTTPPKEMKTKRQYSKPHPPFPQNPHPKFF